MSKVTEDFILLLQKMPKAADWECASINDLQDHIDQKGVLEIDKFFDDLIKKWKNGKINIAVTGNAGVGKSRFINAIRGISVNDKRAAKTGITECTTDAKDYPHPDNVKIHFWDLPGIGTPKYPDLQTYCKNVDLEMCDTFFILTASRFTKNDLDLADKVKSINKSFFFIRTKIDQDYDNEEEKETFNEEAMLKEIRDDCLKNLPKLENEEAPMVFLISNRYPKKWDFIRLKGVILDFFPFWRKECLKVSLEKMTSNCVYMLKRKAESLRGRIWVAASKSAAGGAVPLVSVLIDFALLKSEVKHCKTQLGLTEETEENQKGFFNYTTGTQFATLIGTYVASSTVEEFTRFIPVVGCVIAGTISFSSTMYFLRQYLNECEATALSLLDKLKEKAMDDFENDQ